MRGPPRFAPKLDLLSAAAAGERAKLTDKCANTSNVTGVKAYLLK
ncbi:MAG TPA: hypothetical protein VFH94_26615 [Streptomyces sp.]|nr:hypothetical protein [Streptomyces sp.]